ncbi:F-box domain containing protein [Trema orientale]|uniref:F-box domain containing protein n=1 Tax=Trema orientale TaxID=63057 RepID=A0A2P5F0Z8_TREOI|nr:F-box domain containing protein [Trema orientale]
MVEENSDSFGRLPDEILCRIISFLPCETALETSFLSTRWRGLWNSASVQQSTVDNIDTAVANFVTCYDKLNPLSHPRLLQLHFGESKVLSATLAANNKLKVDFSAGEKEFPRYFDWKLLLNHQNAANQLCPSTSFYVKALHLKSVDFLTSEAVSSVVSNFQFLESLKIIECNGLRSLHIESGPKLVNLTILDCPHLEFLHLKSSKLRSFRFRGKLPRIWPENHFNLADAMLDFRQGPSTYSLISSEFDPALLTIKNAQVVTLCRWTFETLIWPSLLPMKETFKFYKLQELWWIDYSEEDYNTDALMYFLKLCPALERLFVTVDPKSYHMPRTSTILKKSTRHTELGNLKVVKLEGFMNQEDENKLVKDIKDLVTVEPLIVGASNENWTKVLTEAPSPKHAQMSL